jgi:hypothetical protein
LLTDWVAILGRLTRRCPEQIIPALQETYVNALAILQSNSHTAAGSRCLPPAPVLHTVRFQRSQRTSHEPNKLMEHVAMAASFQLMEVAPTAASLIEGKINQAV